MLLFASAFAADDDLGELVERTKSAKQGPDGCWVGEGHATWARGPWKEGTPWRYSSHGQSDFTAVFSDHRWVSTTLMNTIAESWVDGQQTPRPLLRQFNLALGDDPMFPGGNQWPLLVWNMDDRSSGGFITTPESPETMWVERDGADATVRWSTVRDDGPGDPAEHSSYGTFRDGRAEPLAIGWEGYGFHPRPRSFTARKLGNEDRTSYGLRVEFDSRGLPTHEHEWAEPFEEQTVEWLSFHPCGDVAGVTDAIDATHEGPSPAEPVKPDVFGTGAMFQDEVDLETAIQSTVERESLEQAEMMYRHDRSLAGAFTRSGVLLLAAGGAAGACSAWCDVSDKGQGVWLGTAVTLGSVGAFWLLEGVVLRETSHKRWEDRHTSAQP